MPEMIADRQNPKRANGISKQGMRPIEGIDESAFRSLSPSSSLYCGRATESELIEAKLPLVVLDFPDHVDALRNDGPLDRSKTLLRYSRTELVDRTHEPRHPIFREALSCFPTLLITNSVRS